MISIREEITLAMPPEVLWPILSDPAIVASCIPGAVLTKAGEDGVYQGTMRVKFGPTVAVFRGEANLAYDHAARRCSIEGRGIDGRGASRANATGLVEAGGSDTTLLKVEGTFNVTGPLETFANAGGVHLARALLTQIMTALVMAARGNAPVVVFAGDAPIGASWYIQSIDQAPLALATGAHFVAIRTIDRALDCVREAFYIARAERKPVVLSVPLDLQKEEFPYLPDYSPSTELMPRQQLLRPDPEVVDEVVGMIAEAERPIVIGGRGATWSGAKASLEALAQESGALLATTLLGKGLFDGNPFALDVAGTFATDLGRELFAESDLAIAAGAALGHYTTEGGYLFPNARVVRIDTQPRGLWQGLRTADLHVQADAKAAAEAIVSRLKEKGVSRRGWGSNEIAAKIATTADNPDTKPYTPTPGTLDPRPVVTELDAAVPKDWDIIVAGGHCFSFAMTHLRGRPAGKYHIPIDFGAIGSGLPAAIGVAAARNNGKVMLIDGDGSLYQHIQELETVRRHGIKLLICIINDGGYGAETHKFR